MARKKKTPLTENEQIARDLAEMRKLREAWNMVAADLEAIHKKNKDLKNEDKNKLLSPKRHVRTVNSNNKVMKMLFKKHTRIANHVNLITRRNKALLAERGVATDFTSKEGVKAFVDRLNEAVRELERQATVKGLGNAPTPPDQNDLASIKLYTPDGTGGRLKANPPATPGAPEQPAAQAGNPTTPGAAPSPSTTPRGRMRRDPIPQPTPEQMRGQAQPQQQQPQQQQRQPPPPADWNSLAPPNLPAASNDPQSTQISPRESAYHVGQLPPAPAQASPANSPRESAYHVKALPQQPSAAPPPRTPSDGGPVMATLPSTETMERMDATLKRRAALEAKAPALTTVPEMVVTPLDPPPAAPTQPTSGSATTTNTAGVNYSELPSDPPPKQNIHQLLGAAADVTSRNQGSTAKAKKSAEQNNTVTPRPPSSGRGG